jgi:hypothetical protein
MTDREFIQSLTREKFQKDLGKAIEKERGAQARRRAAAPMTNWPVKPERRPAADRRTRQLPRGDRDDLE